MFKITQDVYMKELGSIQIFAQLNFNAQVLTYEKNAYSELSSAKKRVWNAQLLCQQLYEKFFGFFSSHNFYA